MTILEPGAATVRSLQKGEEISFNKPGRYEITISASDEAGNAAVKKYTLSVYIGAEIEVTPKVIKGNKGIFTVRAELPAGVNGQMNLDRTSLNGVKALNSNNGYYNQAKNGQFKFERSDFDWNASEVRVELRSEVNGYLVIGSTTVKVQK
ncbi:hypothetical protein [Peribacillus sp. SCS-37]|uniref:hypothetical protein n=1 Tax=Paraperibacillus esterisolvens TaxID=3115296 RepID=UPI0039069D55